MHSPVGAEVLPCARRLREVDVLSACDGQPVIGGVGIPVAQVQRVLMLLRSDQAFESRVTESAITAAAA